MTNHHTNSHTSSHGADDGFDHDDELGGDGFGGDGFDLDDDVEGLVPLHYGQPNAEPYLSDVMADGPHVLRPRRHELLNDRDRHLWFADMSAWADWAIHTFRLRKWLPACWMRHPQLVEEVYALWMAWMATHLPGDNSMGPATWLRELDAALGRMDRLWQVPCKDTHRDPVPIGPSDPVTPPAMAWWGHPDFDGPSFGYT